MTYTHTHTHTHLFPPFTHCRLHVCFLCIADDEWICVRSGKVVLSQEGVADVESYEVLSERLTMHPLTLQFADRETEARELAGCAPSNRSRPTAM